MCSTTSGTNFHLLIYMLVIGVFPFYKIFIRQYFLFLYLLFKFFETFIHEYLLLLFPPPLFPLTPSYIPSTHSQIHDFFFSNNHTHIICTYKHNLMSSFSVAHVYTCWGLTTSGWITYQGFHPWKRWNGSQ